MKRKVNCAGVILICALFLSGCQQIMAKERSEDAILQIEIEDEILDHSIDDEINHYMSTFMSAYMNDNELEIETRQLLSGSTEGGIITRYKDSNQVIIRYTIAAYGEMGRAIYEYYFINDYMYHSKLVEYYSSPIFHKETEVLYREFDELIILDGNYYQRDQVDGEFHLNAAYEVIYDSLEALEEEFNQAIDIDIMNIFATPEELNNEYQ